MAAVVPPLSALALGSNALKTLLPCKRFTHMGSWGLPRLTCTPQREDMNSMTSQV